MSAFVFTSKNTRFRGRCGEAFSDVKLPRDTRFWATWAALFVAGIAALAYGGTGFQILGMFIVAPTILCALLMGYGCVLYKIVEKLGGDPTAETFGIWIFVSFMFLLSLALAATRHRR